MIQLANQNTMNQSKDNHKVGQCGSNNLSTSKIQFITQHSSGDIYFSVVLVSQTYVYTFLISLHFMAQLAFKSKFVFLAAIIIY